jgi:hypothetical protein
MDRRQVDQEVRKKRNKAGYLTKPLSKKAVKRQVKTVAKLATRPEKRALQGEIRASRLQDDHIDSYFKQYGESLNRINQQTGGALAGSSSAAPHNKYMADLMAIGERQKIQLKTEEAARRASLRKDKRSLARETGDLRREEFARLRDAERDYQLGLGAAKLDKKSLKVSSALEAGQQREAARHNRQSERTSAQNAATSAFSAQTSRKNARLSRQKFKHDKKHPDASETKNDRADIERASVLLRSWAKYLKGKSQSQILDAIMREDQTISRAEAAKAYRAWKRKQGGGGKTNLPSVW